MSQTLAGPCFLKPLEEQVSTAFPQLSLRGSAFAHRYPEPEWWWLEWMSCSCDGGRELEKRLDLRPPSSVVFLRVLWCLRVLERSHRGPPWLSALWFYSVFSDREAIWQIFPLLKEGWKLFSNEASHPEVLSSILGEIVLFMGWSHLLQGHECPLAINSCSHCDNQKHSLKYPAGAGRGVWCSNQSKRSSRPCWSTPGAKELTASRGSPGHIQQLWSLYTAFLFPCHIRQFVPNISLNAESKSKSFPLCTPYHPWDILVRMCNVSPVRPLHVTSLPSYRKHRG